MISLVIESYLVDATPGTGDLEYLVDAAPGTAELPC
jgi:hypothetical protein